MPKLAQASAWQPLSSQFSSLPLCNAWLVSVCALLAHLCGWQHPRGVGPVLTPCVAAAVTAVRPASASTPAAYETDALALGEGHNVHTESSSEANEHSSSSSHASGSAEHGWVQASSSASSSGRKLANARPRRSESLLLLHA